MKGLRLSLSLTGGGPSGGPAYATYALADNFDGGVYKQAATNAGTAGAQYRSPASLAGETFTASGVCYELNSDGTLAGPFGANVPAIIDTGFVAREAFTNLLLNAGGSGSLATQNVTVTAQAYTLSFIGTGTVTLSGASTVGPLVGTGANNRVNITFTPTAGTLTLTVTGAVQYAGLVAGSNPGPIIPTTSAAATRGEALLSHNIFADGSALVDQDMLIFVRGTPKEVVGSQWLFDVNAGSAANRIYLNLSATGLVQAVVEIAGSNVYSTVAAGAVVAGTEITAALRRLSGTWQIGKYVGSTLTWGTVSGALALPTGITKASIGNAQEVNGTVPFRGTISDARIIPGTFDTDAAVIAALNAARAQS